MGLIRDEISKINSLMSSILASAKCLDLFGSVRVELDDDNKLPVLDVDTRCSSKFQMIKYEFTATRIFTAVYNRIYELTAFIIPEVEWEKSAVIHDFLESAAAVTEL